MVNVNGTKVSLRTDTGAEATLIDTKFYESTFPEQSLIPTNIMFCGAEHRQFTAKGYFKTTLSYQNQAFTENIYVVDNASRLLSCQASTTLGLVKFACSVYEFYQKQVSQIIAGLPGTVCLIDDIVVTGKDKQEHDQNLRAVLDRLSVAGVTLNREKCLFKQNSISFLGHVISGDGISADPKKVQAIQQMDPPCDVSELCRFLGMVNQLGKFTKDLASVTKPLRDLLSSKSEWLWSDAQEEAFSNLKNMLSTTPVLILYDPTRKTKVVADILLPMDSGRSSCNKLKKINGVLSHMHQDPCLRLSKDTLRLKRRLLALHGHVSVSETI